MVVEIESVLSLYFPLLISQKFTKSLQPRYLITSLALNDLAIGLLITPFSILPALFHCWPYGEIFCQIQVISINFTWSITFLRLTFVLGLASRRFKSSKCCYPRLYGNWPIHVRSISAKISSTLEQKGRKRFQWFFELTSKILISTNEIKFKIFNECETTKRWFA